MHRRDEDESDAGVVVPPDDAAVGLGDVGGEEGDVVRLPKEGNAIEGGQQGEGDLRVAKDDFCQICAVVYYWHIILVLRASKICDLIPNQIL